jgi:ribose 1,5-bisphosphokinase
MAAGKAGGVSWLLDLKRFPQAQPDQIGPGRLVAVVGPSGAGKDTLIDGARTACLSDPTVVFPRRVVTRPATSSEDHGTIGAEAFRHATVNGAYALWWEAHGHLYGIPSSIDDDLRSGRTVVCNLSRAVVGHVRRRYALVTVVLVTAPVKVLEARLISRGRASDSGLNGRLTRSALPEVNFEADVEILNVGRREIGIRRLLNAIRDPAIFVVY